MHSAKRFKRDHNPEQNVVEMESEESEPELRTFSEVLSLSFYNIDQELYQTVTDLTDFETLEVNNVPTILDAVNLISSDFLRQKFYQTSYSIAIRVKIINEITTLSPLQYEIISTKLDKTRKFLLCLESMSDKKCCFYWKSSDESSLMMLSLIDVEILDRESIKSFVNSFLLLALRFGNDGLSQEAKLTSSTDLSLFSLADVNDKNLLMLASELGNRPVVEDLIKIGFDVNFQVDNQIAADLAWQNRHLDVLFSLLLENSLYPVDFNEANTSNEMKDFVRMTHQFVKSVKNNDEATVQQILDRYPNLRYFYSRDNVSAAFVALSKEKFNIYKIFMSKNVCVGPKEDIDKILSNFNDKKREELRKIHLEHSREPPEKYLMILHSNTSVGHDTINVNEKLNHAKSAIEYLCRISLIRLILQIVAASRDFKLIFDFNRDSVQFLDPTSSKHTRGSFFTSRQIYIAAKFFLDPQRRQEAIGTLAHELCHYAMFLVYKNSCLPYFNGDHKMAKTFHGYLKYCHENRKKEKIVGYVFDIPKENQEMRHAELIVRVPHLLALYHENQEYLDQLREWFLPLFSFFEFKVVEDMKTALPNIEIEGDDEVKKFNDKRKRKGFLRKRNLIIIMIFIAFVLAVGVGLTIYFVIFNNSNNGLVGEVHRPWNVIIRHSRTDEIMCIGSLIHPEFVLTTAECVQKKNHRIPLPPILFVVDFHPIDCDVFRSNVIDVRVYYLWDYSADHLGFDLSLLKLENAVKFTENLYPVNLPPQLDITPLSHNSKKQVLHTILGQHSFNIPTIQIDTTECILDDYKINRFLGDQQYCARHLDNQHCIAGHGEQLYESKADILHGLVSMGHRTEAHCINNNSLIITELGYYTDEIRRAVCNERPPIPYWSILQNEYRLGDMWRVTAYFFDFMAVVVEKSSKNLLCWSIFITTRILLTDSNCIKSYSPKDIQLVRNGEFLPEIGSILHNPDANISKIILTSDASLNEKIDILEFKELEDLQDVSIVYDYEIYNETYKSRYFLYEKIFNRGVFSSFCVQVSGGPIFLNSDYVSYYGIVTMEPCGDDCNIGDNGFKVGYVRLYDHKDWINGEPLETTPTPDTIDTTTRRFPTIRPPPDWWVNPIDGEFINQDYCNNEGCRLIQVFSTISVKIEDAAALYYINAELDDQVEGLESKALNKSLTSLPIDVVDIFPNLVTYTFTNTGVKEISLGNFRGLVNLEVIALDGNEIETIQWDTFNHTKNLRNLNLQSNKISFINEYTLAPLQNLEVFWIGSNLLKNDLANFKYSLKLKEIILSNNGITEIHDNIFLTCSSLERINLSSNEIRFLNSDIFLNKTNLMSVDLTGNICVNQVFVGSNGTRFTTNDLNLLLNATSTCNISYTTFRPA